MLFGEFIKDKRLSLKYSSTMLGQKVGISASFINGIERGAQFPSTVTACKILQALNVTYYEIDAVTIGISEKDGPVFEFRSSLRGRNREPAEQPVKNEKMFLTQDHQIRIAALNATVLVSTNERLTHENFQTLLAEYENYIRGTNV